MADTKAFVCAILFMAMLFGGAGIAGGIEHNYVRKDCVVIWEGDGIVRVEDKCGYIWEFEGEGYTVGVHLDLKMHTNFTHETIFDDRVTGVC